MGEIEQRRCEVNVQCHFSRGCTCWDFTGVTNEEGNADRRFVHVPFIIKTMLTKEETVIRRVNDDSVVAEVVFIKVAKQASDVFVNGSYTPEIALNEGLVQPGIALFFVKTIRN